MAAHDWVFSILFSEFSLPVTFFWYWPLLCSTKLFKPKYVGNKRKNKLPNYLKWAKLKLEDNVKHKYHKHLKKQVTIQKNKIKCTVYCHFSLSISHDFQSPQMSLEKHQIWQRNKKFCQNQQNECWFLWQFQIFSFGSQVCSL